MPDKDRAWQLAAEADDGGEKARLGDNATGELGAKGFYVESFVTSSRVAVTEDGAKTVVNTQVENGPPGMRTPYTITRQDGDRYQGVFEMAMPGQDFVCLQNLYMRRVK